MKKILGTLAVAGLLAGGAYWVRGPLAVADAPYAHLRLPSTLADTSYPVGDYKVTLTGGTAPLLRIYRKGQTHAVFESIPGRAFVAAGRGRDEFHEARGMVRVDTSTPVRCTDQRIDAVQADDAQVTVSGTLQCLDGAQPYRMRLQGGAGGNLAFSVELLPRPDAKALPYNRVLLVAASSADEGIYGFGEQFSTFNQKGRLLPILVSEQGVGRGLQPITFAADITNNGAGGKWHTSYAGRAALHHHGAARPLARHARLRGVRHAPCRIHRGGAAWYAALGPLPGGQLAAGTGDGQHRADGAHATLARVGDAGCHHRLAGGHRQGARGVGCSCRRRKRRWRPSGCRTGWASASPPSASSCGGTGPWTRSATPAGTRWWPT